MDLASLQAIVRLLDGGEPVALVYPVHREGSIPTPRDALLVVHTEGESGTVGGGILEADAIACARSALSGMRHLLLSRTLDAAGVADNQMLCGGDVTLMVEYLAPETAGLWADMENAALRGENCGWRCHIALTGDHVQMHRTALKHSAASPSSLAPPDQGGSAGSVWIRPSDAGFELHDPIVIPDALLVFGAGHVALALVPIATRLGFRCWVVDDRQEYASLRRFPEAYRVVVADPAYAVQSCPVGNRVWAAIMTRGHKDDARVLARLVGGDYRYVGMVGSARKRAAVWEHLIEQGIPPAALDAVRCPIGLPIGGTTPHEIAVSIAAELVAVRHGAVPALQRL